MCEPRHGPAEPPRIPRLLAGALLLLLVAGCGGSGGGAAAPTVASVTPSSDFASGGARVALTGTGFASGSHAITIGGAAATDVVTVDDTRVTCTVPAGETGPADVTISHEGGSATLAGGFTYYSFPPAFPAADRRVDVDVADDERSLSPKLCCNGTQAFATWYGRRGGTDFDVSCNSSVDGGQTWQAASPRLNTGVPGSDDSTFPQICCDGPVVHVCWKDNRDGSSDVYYSRSTDGGTTWLGADTRLDTSSPGSSNSLGSRICCAGSNVYVAWQDSRNGPFYDIFLNRSTDGGATWQASDTRLETDLPGAAHSGDVAICCHGRSVYVVWRSSRDGDNDVYLNHSQDGGATWLAADLRLNTNAAGAAGSLSPSICCDGMDVYVVWRDLRSGDADVYFNHSSDGGVSWQASDTRLDTDPPGASNSLSPRICCHEKNVFVVWYDDRSGGDDIYFNRSTDGGVTWQATDSRLDSDAPGASDSSQPEVCCAGSNVYVAWRDARLGTFDVFLRASRDAGATWQATDTRLNTNAPGSVSAWDTSICCDGARVCAAWQDHRVGGVGHVFAVASQP